MLDEDGNVLSRVTEPRSVKPRGPRPAGDGGGAAGAAGTGLEGVPAVVVEGTPQVSPERSLATP